MTLKARVEQVPNGEGQVTVSAGEKNEFFGRSYFPSAFEAFQFVEALGWEIEESPLYLGYRLGSAAIALSEGKFDKSAVLEGLIGTTDGQWSTAVRELAKLLDEAADQM